MSSRASSLLWCLSGVLSLLACSSARAEVPTGVQSLASASGEIETGPRWRGVPAGGPRNSLEFESRQAVAGPWNDGTRLDMRYTHWSPSSQRGSVGVSMGVATAQTTNPALPLAANQQVAVAPEVGVRWRSGWSGDRRVDVGAYGSYDASVNTPSADRRSYGARVELQFREGRSPLGLQTGALGMHLNSSSQLMLRSRHGGPMLYYRSQW